MGGSTSISPGLTHILIGFHTRNQHLWPNEGICRPVWLFGTGDDTQL